MSNYLQGLIRKLQIPDGNATTKLIGVFLAESANEDGMSYPNQDELAKDAQCSDRSVRRHIKALENLGVLSIKIRNLPGGRTSNAYQIHESKLLELLVTQDKKESSKTPADNLTGGSETQKTSPPDNLATGQNEQAHRTQLCPPNLNIPYVSKDTLIGDTDFDLTGESEPDWKHLERQGVVFKMPSDWQPNPDSWALAKTYGLSDKATSILIAEFIAYWRQQNRARKGWDRTFIQHLRSQHQRGKIQLLNLAAEGKRYGQSQSTKSSDEVNQYFQNLNQQYYGH